MQPQHDIDALACNGSDNSVVVATCRPRRTSPKYRRVVTGKMIFDSAVSDYAIDFRARHSTGLQSSGRPSGTPQRLRQKASSRRCTRPRPHSTPHARGDMSRQRLVRAGGFADEYAAAFLDEPERVQLERLDRELNDLAKRWSATLLSLSLMSSSSTHQPPIRMGSANQPSLLNQVSVLQPPSASSSCPTWTRCTALRIVSCLTAWRAGLLHIWIGLCYLQRHQTVIPGEDVHASSRGNVRLAWEPSWRIGGVYYLRRS
ncbi:hypothetical protein L226DRAFT_401358 [Lentinus tigrinus ALCF2SS1-7]|uniref:Uncharacterized protein n=1 Tax=Lentinus tigrinus ALCF2SS1-6 TaxID=1328759 RepID=A0A5C2RR08_9APHY|nr:hypothetical protein L227DRAFT_62524 [Lentinus tigrinus ALCF2SS1-6]RPD52867.1 hypothetical protein L227DRAFT_428013 [Lentinus tigrinus ALCF2SS1-6]RPD67783.1 hypothetical protein L226DRAFT_401358 [Lentinus tigrinus ALCF2SS1-7]